MIEELKYIVDLIAKIPETGLWILGGFGIYKLVSYLSVTGSVVFILKLAIERIYQWHKDNIDLMSKREEAPKPVSFMNGRIITHDLTLSHLEHLLYENIKGKGPSKFIHSDDVDWFQAAIREKKEREGRK